ncbi:MAG TPA: hypothetical protein VNZ53_57515 [Steroidobacteraceae bacterium]|nr:hypothetical protein [Steroidobacteraceae bacterium]
MAQKTTHQHTDSSSAVPVVLFGVDDNGKPKAARFNDKHANLATKAAGHLKLHVLPIVGPVVVDLAGHVPAGRIHANGRGFVPYIRRDLYAKLGGSRQHLTRRLRVDTGRGCQWLDEAFIFERPRGPAEELGRDRARPCSDCSR